MEARVNKHLMRLLVFLQLMVQVSDEAEEYWKNTSPEDFEAEKNNPMFQSYNDFDKLIKDIVRKYGFIIKEPNYKAVKNKLDLDMRIIYEKMPDQKNFYPVVFFISMLQQCDFGRIKTDDVDLIKLFTWDYEKIVEVRGHYGLVNSFDFFKLSKLFGRLYFENYN